MDGGRWMTVIMWRPKQLSRSEWWSALMDMVRPNPLKTAAMWSVWLSCDGSGQEVKQTRGGWARVAVFEGWQMRRVTTELWIEDSSCPHGTASGSPWEKVVFPHVSLIEGETFPHGLQVFPTEPACAAEFIHLILSFCGFFFFFKSLGN